MATIISNTGRRKMQQRDPLQTLLAACKAALNAFTSNRLRHAASAAQKAPSRGRHRRQDPPAGERGVSHVRLAPLDPEVLSEIIPAFFIGRNRAGLWVARDAKGRAGGLFLLKSSAVAFARGRSAGCALIFPTERFELDLPNEGNPLADHFGFTARRLAGTPRGPEGAQEQGIRHDTDRP